jgi:hypothetical protein
MTNYLALFNRLKADAPQALELVNEHEAAARAHPQFATLQKIVAESGMEYAAFVDLSSRIGTIFSVSEVNMQSYQKMSEQNVGQMDQMAKSLQEMIDDPDMPAAQKTELRAALKRAQTGKRQLGNMWKKNKTKYQKMTKRLEKKLGKIASEKDVQLVNKYRKDLEKAYQGISRPRIVGSL